MSTTQPPPVPVASALRHRWARFIPALLILAFLGFRYLQTQRTRAPRHIDLAELHLVDLRGTPLSPALLQGKALILNFWAPWCPPCLVETPALQNLQDTHPSALLVIGIVADPEQYPQSQAFMASRHITYPLARDSSTLHRIFGEREAVPTTFYIDPTGRVLHTASGLLPAPIMQRYANDLTPH